MCVCVAWGPASGGRGDGEGPGCGYRCIEASQVRALREGDKGARSGKKGQVSKVQHAVSHAVRLGHWTVQAQGWQES